MDTETTKNNEQFPASEKSRRLLQKLHEVMKAVKRIPKNGYNSRQDYRYVMEADVVEFLRDIFVEVGLVVSWTCLSSSVRTVEGKSPLVSVTIEVVLTDIETGGSFVSRVIGEATDAGDKAIWKAYTGAFKYFLLKTFMMSTGDDPENDERETNAKTHKSETTPARSANMEQTKKEEHQPQENPKPSNRASDTIQEAVKTAPDIKTVNDLLKSVMTNKGLGPSDIDELNKLAATRRTELRRGN